MKDGFISRDAWTGEPTAIVRSETGTKLHIPVCPHIGGGIRLADDAERAAYEMCSWCQKEVDGVGRRYYDDLDEAMRAFKSYAGTERLIKEALAGVGYDQIWIPNSQSYVALGLGGQARAWFGKTYVMPSLDVLVELPGFAPGADGGAEKREQFGALCEVHFVERSVSGVCDLCED